MCSVDSLTASLRELCVHGVRFLKTNSASDVETLLLHYYSQTSSQSEFFFCLLT